MEDLFLHLFLFGIVFSILNHLVGIWYIEALDRAKDFEYNRLCQNYTSYAEYEIKHQALKDKTKLEFHRNTFVCWVVILLIIIIHVFFGK